MYNLATFTYSTKNSRVRLPIVFDSYVTLQVITIHLQFSPRFMARVPIRIPRVSSVGTDWISSKVQEPTLCSNAQQRIIAVDHLENTCVTIQQLGGVD